MSTAASAKSSGGGYEVGRPQGRCIACGRDITTDEKFVAALLETTSGFQRIDCCAGCWPGRDRTDVLAFWQATMPKPEQKKRLFVDDTILSELFERLADVTEPAKLNFRFVLGLILMRKRLIIYETTRQDGEREIWSVRMKGKEEFMDLLNPRLTEEQVKDVSQQLGEVLQQEL